MNEAALIAGMAAVTFAVRYPVLALLGKIELPPLVLRALRYVPAAVLTAIVVPAVLMPAGDRLEISPANAYLVAGIIAALVSWRSKSLLLTIIAGMAAFFAWRTLFPA
jgi:branched-subunit amino acid transport protein